MIAVWIALAGGLGAMARFLADGLIRTRLGRKFPWGTLIINISGSFVLGILTGMVLNHHTSLNTKLIVGTGFCGGFTTFSTASFETVRLIEERRFWAALFQAFGNMSLSLGAAALGIWLVTH